jgi:hypothetical protein
MNGFNGQEKRQIGLTLQFQEIPMGFSALLDKIIDFIDKIFFDFLHLKRLQFANRDTA